MPRMVDATIRIEAVIETNSAAEREAVLEMPSRRRSEMRQGFMGDIREVIQNAPKTYWSWDSLRMEVDNFFLLDRAGVRQKLALQLQRMNRELAANGSRVNLSLGLVLELPPGPKLPRCGSGEEWRWRLNKREGGSGEAPWTRGIGSGPAVVFVLSISWEIPKPDAWDHEDPEDWN